jgi:DNA polymerase-3 subunit chi
LWSFDPTSFIAHGIDQLIAQYVFQLNYHPSNDWIVFNFNNHALEQTQDFRHIIEIIENNETAKQIGREKFKMYRRLGIDLEHLNYKRKLNRTKENVVAL